MGKARSVNNRFLMNLASHELNHILIRKCVGKANSLRLVLCTAAPNKGVLELFGKVAMDSMTDVLNSTVAAHNEGLIE